MAGGASDVNPTKEEINVETMGLYMQLAAGTRLVELYGSVANAIEELGLGDFVDNQIAVRASALAWVHRTEMREFNKQVTHSIEEFKAHDED